MFQKLSNPFEMDGIKNIRGIVYKTPVKVLSQFGISAHMINTFGLITGLLAAVFIGLGQIGIGTLLYFFSGLSDSLDGPVARYQNKASDFGAFYDSVSDRYVDIAMLIGVAWYYFNQDQPLYSLLAMISILGASLISYTKARAEALGVQSRNIGLMTRPLRGISLLMGLIYLPILPPILWFQAIFSNITAIHRFVYYGRVLQRRDQDT